MEYFAFDAKDVKEEYLDTVYKIEKQYLDTPTLYREMRTCFRGDARLLIAWQDDEVVGFYIYGPARTFLVQPQWLPFKTSFEYDVDECCIPLYAHFTRDVATSELYQEFNAIRVDDARHQGYRYGIVGLNATRDIEDITCFQAKWMQDGNPFEERANAKMIELPFKNQHGVPVKLQVY